MGFKRVVETKKVERLVYTCDICGLSINGRIQCSLCRRYICSSHAHWHGPGPEDFGVPFCDSCWQAGAAIRAELEALTLATEEKEDALHEAWKRAALDALKGGA
uniref:Uncharacterized protein n=1 Tax=viral metagenome TaxID=1070528 RepID=A0A6M3K7P4_9ZZZZ